MNVFLKFKKNRQADVTNPRTIIFLNILRNSAIQNRGPHNILILSFFAIYSAGQVFKIGVYMDSKAGALKEKPSSHLLQPHVSNVPGWQLTESRLPCFQLKWSDGVVGPGSML